MPFSSKAQEIYDHIVSSGKADYWIGVARSLIKRKGQQPGRPYVRDVQALRDKLQAELSDEVKDANDHHWEEIDLDMDGDKSVPEQGSFVDRKGERWRVVQVNVETSIAEPFEVPVHRVFLTNRL